MSKGNEVRMGTERKWYIIRRLVIVLIGMLALGGAALQANAAFPSGSVTSPPLGVLEQKPNPATDPYGIANYDCANIARDHVDKQTNMRAVAIIEKCSGSNKDSSKQEQQKQAVSKVLGALSQLVPFAYGGPDKNVHPSSSTAIQSETFSWRNGNTIVVAYNDISGGSTGKASYSTDGGATFSRVPGDPFASGHGSNFGDPAVVYDVLHGKWITTWLTSGCGGQGVGAWTSTDGITWTTAGCAANAPGGSGDRNSAWQDNNPASPFYGRSYVTYNDFSIGGGALRSAFSTDGGTTWSSPVNITANFIRDVQLTGMSNGNLVLAGMNEGGGGAANRTNMFYTSTNGGVTWTAVTANTFTPPGNANCAGNSYFRVISTGSSGLRHMGWGQPGGGPSNVVHYAYAAHGTSTDEGDIYYIRSTDGGATWSAPLKLNTDSGTRAQWMPSLGVTAAGGVFVKWYDRRDTANNDYWIYGRASQDNGLTWQADEPVSDAVIPQPLVQTGNCYMGDYDYWHADGSTVHGAWTDSRGAGSGGTQDVFYDGIPSLGGTPTPTVTGTPPTNTPTFTLTSTPTPTLTFTAVPTACGVFLSEGFESGTLGAFTNVVATCVPGGCNWVSVAQTPRTGVRSAFAPDGDNISDQYLQQTSPVMVTAGSTLSFWHRYDLESTFDGGVLESSTNGGTTWVDMGANITTGGYNSTISVNFQSPIAGRQAWSGAFDGAYTQVIVNLTPYAGQNLQIRFRLATDNSVSATGWRIDDIVIAPSGGGATCTPGPTNTTGPTNTSTSTNTPTSPPATDTPENTPTPEDTATSVPTDTPEASPTSTVCALQFTDVPVGHTFYDSIRCLACRGIINGYPCGGTGEPCNGNNDPYFRPGNLITRGQLSKIVSQSAGFIEPVTGQTFEDVPPSSTFYEFVERLASRGVMGGYQCGIDPAEPCGPGNLPYFRPGSNATRGQLTKIVSNAAGFSDPAPSTFTFTDVPAGSTFHIFVERLLINRPGAISGYPCGSPGEPCDSENRPYFRPNNSLTRGQASKIVTNTFFPDCVTPRK